MRLLLFGPSLGFGEAKVQSRANYNLCHDLLPLALFGKENTDMNKLAGCLSFQIHGNTIRYLGGLEDPIFITSDLGFGITSYLM